ncbi:uncharacterized protein [Arachis hypogaea]|uniref:uncharacterized protein n=1 Tax=Arachis hypogaea TaxID=3818 RepID=UPI000DEC22FF|nr:E3 ubiquitin-protein ligase RNF14-like [Arachis hypogaea]XP_025697856.1 E3 ubiquitin-protein ligase RNF14-like [Arachis hypogaea]
MSTRKTRGGRNHRNHHRTPHHDDDDSFTPKPLYQQHHHQQQHSTPPTHHRHGHHNHYQQPKLRFVKKSELDSSASDSLLTSDPVAVPAADHVTPLPHENHKQEENNNNNNNISVSDAVTVTREVDHKACSSNSKEVDDDDADDYVVNRLRRLLDAVEEPALMEQQLSTNDQLQEDELLVVESIYGENVNKLESWKGLRCFQIQIHIEVLGEIAIIAKLNSSNELDVASGNSDDFFYSFKVQYLPPIVLTCLLPKSYPSHQPPLFTVSVQWLESLDILSLCSQLDSIWAEQQGQEVIYQWVDWLQSSSLSHLGFDKEIILGRNGVNCVGDERVVSGSISLDAAIPFLRGYNKERHNENFLKELHECSICFSEYPGTEFVRLPCQHFFCLKCLQTFTQMHVKEGTISNLQCPDSKCKVMIPPGLLKHLLGDEEYERWESMMLERTLASMSDVVYCPRCETPCIEDEDQHAQCSKCYFSFCTLCRERRHVGIACMTLDMKLQILQDRQNSSQLKEDQKLREREKINEMLSMKEIHRDSKLCPSCSMAINRTEGCNKMKCSNCGAYFCYRCNKLIDPSDPYGHFRDGSCELFPQEMIENWQERINHRQVVGQLQAELFRERGLPCPNCRQFNAKVGNNNHMFCWACQSHYCYLCNEIVRRGSKHYGPKGCKQHTEG